MKITRELCESIVNNFINEAFLTKLKRPGEQADRLGIGALTLTMAGLIGTVAAGSHGLAKQREYREMALPSNMERALEPIQPGTTRRGNPDFNAEKRIFGDLVSMADKREDENNNSFLPDMSGDDERNAKNLRKRLDFVDNPIYRLTRQLKANGVDAKLVHKNSNTEIKPPYFK